MVLNRGMLHKTMGTRFVRSGPPLGTNDLKTYDSGRVFLATLGDYGPTPGGTQLVGSFSVSYDVTFYAPTLNV